MFTFLVVLISLIALLLCIIILIQAGKGGGLAASFGGASSSTDSFMGGRQAANALTRMSWYGGGAFLFLSLVLAVLSSNPNAAPESILRQGMPGGQPLQEAPASLLELAPDPATDEVPADESGAAESGAEPTAEGDPGLGDAGDGN